jgi:hypothetical protein
VVGLLGIQTTNNKKCKLKREIASLAHQTSNFNKMKVILVTKMAAKVVMIKNKVQIQTKMKILVRKV